MVAKAISEHGAEGGAYDQVIVGYLLQIADELKTGGGNGAPPPSKRIGTRLDESRGGVEWRTAGGAFDSEDLDSRSCLGDRSRGSQSCRPRKREVC